MSGAASRLLVDAFDVVADWVGCVVMPTDGTRGPADDIVLFVQFAGETSDFVRFNHARVRQAGTVRRLSASLRLMGARRSARASLTLSGVADEDRRRLQACWRNLIDDWRTAPVDPFLLFEPVPSTGQRIDDGRLPDAAELVGAVDCASVDAGPAARDLVGFFMAGPKARGLASSLGHRHFHQTSDWSFDFSVFAGEGARRDQAVKSSVAAAQWSAGSIGEAVRQAAARAAVFAQPVRELKPGSYRVLLAPQACAELLGTLAWGGFSARALKTGQSPLKRLHAGDRTFDPRIDLHDDLRAAGVPAFHDAGFVRPSSIPLVREGRFADWLVSPRSSREFDLPGNAANDGESPDALRMQPGELSDAQALAALDTGLAISNLWYLNYSDRDSARVTGMTRFATTWVEGGRVVAPVGVMRFDDSLYDLFGPNLEALGDRAQWLPNTDSYEWRGFGGMSVPAALISRMSFTL